MKRKIKMCDFELCCGLCDFEVCCGGAGAPIRNEPAINTDQPTNNTTTSAKFWLLIYKTILLKLTILSKIKDWLKFFVFLIFS